MSGRKKNRAKALLRRSTDRQEMSLVLQLRWAIDTAKQLGVKFNGSPEDLEWMISRGLVKYKDLYLDDAVTGSDLCRPGLQALIADCRADPDISHVLAYKADRLARPEEPLEAVAIENILCYAGITLVFSERIAEPRQRGVDNSVADLVKLMSYSQANNDCIRLAERVVAGQVKAAEEGAWAGGRAPYGFARVLVRIADNEILQDIPDGVRVRQPGCRTKIVPRDEAKIAVWLRILQLHGHDKWGGRRIANHLNDLGIPSPGAGRERTDHGITHPVPGRWTHSTVLSLIRNRAIIGMSSYGVQSEGRLRRHGADGPRLLEAKDRTKDNKPKVVQNPDELVVSKPTGFESPADIKLFNDCQNLLAERGKDQRGISRRTDLSRYPLALRIFDITDRCGFPMYAKTSGERPVYLCSRYMRSAGRECSHNAVDGEAAFQFTLGFLHAAAERIGGREALRQRLERIAEREINGDKQTPDIDGIERTEAQLSAAESELGLIRSNWARAKDRLAYDALEDEYKTQQKRITVIRAALDKLKAAPTPKSFKDAGAEIDAALALFDQLEGIRANPTARSAIAALLEKIQFRMWLNFGPAKKGNRPVRKLRGGIVTTGDTRPPVPPYGLDGGGQCHGHCSDGMLPTPAGNEMPSVDLDGQPEGVSLTMVSRGDKI